MLKGLYYWERRTPETLDKAKDYFNQAIQKDPGLRPGIRQGTTNYYVAGARLRVRYRRAKPLQKRRRPLGEGRIDPSSADAHAALAGSLWSLFDFSQLEPEFRRALEL